jgi:hypothetical protein
MIALLQASCVKNGLNLTLCYHFMWFSICTGGWAVTHCADGHWREYPVRVAVAEVSCNGHGSELSGLFSRDMVGWVCDFHPYVCNSSFSVPIEIVTIGSCFLLVRSSQVVLSGVHHYVAMQLTAGVPVLLCGTPGDVKGVVDSLKRFCSPTPLNTHLMYLFKPEEFAAPYSRVQHSMVIASTTVVSYKVFLLLH